MRPRYLPITLPDPAYDRLAAWAEQEDRDPLQQARYLLKRLLEDPTPPTRSADALGTPARSGTSAPPLEAGK